MRWKWCATLSISAAGLILLTGCSGGSNMLPAPSPTPPAWMQLSISGPTERWTHAAVLDPARHNAAIFGGFVNDTKVWIFSFATRTWTAVDAPNGPTPRASPGAVADPAGDRMIIVGGITTVPTDEVWQFSFANQTWSPLPRGPSPRFDIGSATDGKHGYFYGGFLPSAAGNIATDELWQFDFASNTWTLLPQSSVRPSQRTNMGIGVHNGSLFVVGGHDQNGLTPGTWRYDFATNNWTQLSPTGVQGAGAHFSSAVDDACGVLLLAGGDHDDNIDINTTDVLNLAQPVFTRFPVSSDFTPTRRHATLTLEPVSRTLLLFGGLHDPSPVLGDTWILQMTGCN